MKDVKALIAGLVKEPGLLSNLVKDPQAIVRLAQLADPDRKALQAMGQMVSNLTARLAAPPACQTGPARASIVRPAGGQAVPGGTGSQAVALTGIVSLAAVAGAVVVVGAVSLVAVSAHSERAQP